MNIIFRLRDMKHIRLKSIAWDPYMITIAIVILIPIMYAFTIILPRDIQTVNSTQNINPTTQQKKYTVTTKPIESSAIKGTDFSSYNPSTNTQKDVSIPSLSVSVPACVQTDKHGTDLLSKKNAKNKYNSNHPVIENTEEHTFACK